MGVLIRRSDDSELYNDAYEEAQRIICISDEVRISLEQVASEPESETDTPESSGKLTSSKLAQKLGIKTSDLTDKLISAGFLETKEGKPYLTEKGKVVGGEYRKSPKYGYYFLWPESIKL